MQEDRQRVGQLADEAYGEGAAGDFIIEPAMWMVAQSGMQKLAISSLTPFFFV